MWSGSSGTCHATYACTRMRRPSRVPTSCSPLDVVFNLRSTSIVLSTGAGTFHASPGFGQYSNRIAKSGDHDRLTWTNQNETRCEHRRADNDPCHEKSNVTSEPAARGCRFVFRIVVSMSAMVMVVMRHVLNPILRGGCGLAFVGVDFRRRRVVWFGPAPGSWDGRGWLFGVFGGLACPGGARRLDRWSATWHLSVGGRSG